MAENKELNDLYAQLNGIERRIRKAKRKVAKEKGEIVDSVDDLVCEEHPEVEFVYAGLIPNSRTYTRHLGNGWGLQIFQCKTCKPNYETSSKAYECPECGIVIGDFERRGYKSLERRPRSEGEHYHCRICKNQIGHYYLGETVL